MAPFSWSGRLAGCFCALASGALALTPNIETGRWREANAVLEKWLQVQGVDRPNDEIYPQDSSFEIESGKPAKSMKVRFINSGSGGYFVALQAADGARSFEISNDGRNYWVLSDTLGIGAFNGTSDLMAALRQERKGVRFLRENYATWERLPDEEHEGKKFQVVAMGRLNGGHDIWWFDAEKGVLVRTAALTQSDKVLAARAEFGDFREVDGVLEPFEVRTETGEGLTVLRMSKRANRVKLAEKTFELAPAQFRQWSQSEEVLKKYVRACGGEAALAQIVSRVTKATGENTTTGAKFEITMSQKAPSLFLAETNTKGIGRSWQGYDGQTGWEYSELQGARTMRGQELELFRRNNMLNLENFSRLFPMRKLLGVKEVNGRRTAAVELASRQQHAGVHYFDLQTGQLLRIESVLNLGAEGNLPVTIDFSDFRPVDKITLPFKTVMTNPALTIVTTVDSVQQNVEIDDAIFKPRKD